MFLKNVHNSLYNLTKTRVHKWTDVLCLVMERSKYILKNLFLKKNQSINESLKKKKKKKEIPNLEQPGLR